MNRRTVLRSAGVLATVSLAGCADAVAEHFQGSLRGIVPIEIHSEADQTHNIQLKAHEYQTSRQTYDQGYSVTPGQTVSPPHLEASSQSLRIVRFHGTDDEEADVREVSITPNTQLVTIWLYDDDLVIELHRGDEDGNETHTETINESTAEGLENETAADDENGTGSGVEPDDDSET